MVFAYAGKLPGMWPSEDVTVNLFVEVAKLRVLLIVIMCAPFAVGAWYMFYMDTLVSWVRAKCENMLWERAGRAGGGAGGEAKGEMSGGERRSRGGVKVGGERGNGGGRQKVGERGEG